MGWNPFRDFVEHIIEPFYEDVLKPIGNAIHDGLESIGDRFEEDVTQEIKDEIFDLDAADSTAEITEEQGVRPQTDAPVRHVVTMDGTGQDGGSTVHDLHQATAAVGPDGTIQQTAYFRGSGTEHSGLGDLFNQASGADIPNGILETYRHLAANFQTGDEILLRGYSRGGFEAISVTGMIDTIGLIDTTGMTPEQIDAATQEALELYLSNPSDVEIQAFRDRYPVHDAPILR